MTELGQMLQALKQPEYVHVLLNPMPVYGLACGVLGLIVALILRTRPAQIVALVIVAVACASVIPVVRMGHRGYDRVYAMSNSDGQKWLAAHADRADDAQYAFYLTGVLAIATMLIPAKFPKARIVLFVITLACSLAMLGVGGWISHAGGQVRHTEFRTGPAPQVEEHQD